MTASALLEQPPSALASTPRRKPGPAPVRVLHVINGEHYSGAERVQDLLAGKLPELGFEVGFVCLKPGRFPEVRKCREAPLHEIAMRSRWDLRTVGRLVRIVRQGDYRILHAHTPRTLLIAALASLVTGVPLVYHVHSPTSRDSTHRWRNRLNALVEWLGMRAASALIAVSGSLADHTRGLGFSKRKVSVVRNGVPGRAARSARPATKREWTLGTVALFRPRKGMEVLLEALATLRAQGSSVRLRAVGGFETPEYERAVKCLVEKLGLADAVEWTGFTEEVDRELAEMDLFVLPSLFGEGLPMVVLEAMAAGVPVVATRVEGVPEAIRDRRDGLLAEPADPGSLARAIGRVVDGEVDWHALRTSARKRHAEAFSDRSMAAGVAEVYRRVLKAE
ncbi:MAG TPA: glycosyltransferase [Thermoguttaceae bacterium]|nr:glycosyltransferase [Thermoguttaceae bacterium]